MILPNTACDASNTTLIFEHGTMLWVLGLMLLSNPTYKISFIMGRVDFDLSDNIEALFMRGIADNYSLKFCFTLVPECSCLVLQEY